VTNPVGAGPSVFHPSSPEAHAIADLFGVTLGICAVIFAVVLALVAYSLLRFRDREDGKEPAQVHGNTRLEVAWTVAPFLVLVGIFALTLRAARASDPPADRDPDIVVVAHQWWWEARYPATGAVTANEIHIPVGRPVLIRLEAADVVHDFWVPELGRKIDAVPGHPNNLWMEASAPGAYQGACAEYCGAQHAWMRILVVAEEVGQFEAWQAHEASPAAAPTDARAAHGAQIFRDLTCVKCHSVTMGTSPPNPVGGASEGARIAPDLTHLASRRTLAAGAVDENTPATLAGWLKNPDDFKPGSHMPNLRLSDAQVNDLVTYFETLR
jgi:cytochrome c oxidase subunit II